MVDRLYNEFYNLLFNFEKKYIRDFEEAFSMNALEVFKTYSKAFMINDSLDVNVMSTEFINTINLMNKIDLITKESEEKRIIYNNFLEAYKSIGILINESNKSKVSKKELAVITKKIVGNIDKINKSISKRLQLGEDEAIDLKKIPLITNLKDIEETHKNVVFKWNDTDTKLNKLSYFLKKSGCTEFPTSFFKMIKEGQNIKWLKSRHHLAHLIYTLYNGSDKKLITLNNKGYWENLNNLVTYCNTNSENIKNYNLADLSSKVRRSPVKHKDIHVFVKNATAIVQ